MSATGVARPLAALTLIALFFGFVGLALSCCQRSLGAEVFQVGAVVACAAGVCGLQQRDRRSWATFFSVAALLSLAAMVLSWGLGVKASHLLVGLRHAFVVAAVVLLGRSVRAALKRSACRGQVGGVDRCLQAALSAVVSVGTAAAPLRFEMLCLAYAVLPRRLLQEEASSEDEVFSNLRQGENLSSHHIVLILGLIETGALHFIARLWSPLAAWLLTVSSAYALYVVCANMRALRLRPCVATAEGLLLRNGVLFDAAIAWPDVAGASEIRRGESRPAGASLQGLGGVNACVRTRRPVEVRGPMGLRRAHHVLLLGVDDPSRFVSTVNARLAPCAAMPIAARALPEPAGAPLHAGPAPGR